MSNTLRKAFYGPIFFAALCVCLLSLGGHAKVLAAENGAAASPKGPWYRDISTIISVTALAFSFGTTFVSYHRTEMQDIQASRQELRGILQRLSAIPRENLEAAKRYAGDQSSIAGVSQLYNQESTMLSRQAAEIAKRLPKNLVSGTEYYAIAVAFQSSYNLSAAKEFLNLAMAVANNFNDEIGAIRSSANLDFITGRPEEGRVLYQQALNIFAKYPGYDPYTIASTHIYTEIFWGGSEVGIGQFQLATQHADNAQRIVEALPASMGSDGLKAQIEQARQQLARAVSAGTASGPVIPAQTWLPH
jgi:hypothetical protein